MANEYQVTQIAAEVLETTPSDARVSAIYVEILAAIEEVEPPIAPGLLTDFFDGSGDSAVFTVSVERRVYPAGPVLGLDGEVYPIRQRIPKFTVKDVERNPYATNRPDDWEEQQRVLREQHNKIQAGDTTFDAGLLLKSTPNRLYTPGSLGRFYHETYGLVLARYVRFAGMLDADYQCAPVGRLANGSGKVDWVVTNDLTRSSPSLAEGFVFIADTPPDGYYGWMVIHGANLVTAGPENDDLPVQGDIYTWTRTGYVGVNSPGKPLATRWDRPTEPGILAGQLMIRVEGISPADLGDFVINETAPLQAQVDTIDSQVAAHNSRLGTLDSQVAQNSADLGSLSDRLLREEQARIRDVASIRNQITNATDWSGSINSAVNGLRIEFSAAITSVDIKATNALSRIDNLESALTGFNLNLVTQQINNLAVAVGTLSQSTINADLTGLTTGQTLVTTTIATPDGGTTEQFQPVDFKLVELLDYDNTTPATDGQVPTWDAGASKFVPATPTGGGGGGAFSGARVYDASADFAVTSGSTQILSVWDTESFDIGGWWDPANPSWFTVPAGVEYAEATLQLQRSNSVTGQFIGQIALYDSSDALIGVLAVQETDTDGGDNVSVSTGPFAVTAGQRIKARYFVTNTGNMAGGQYGCAFAVRAVSVATAVSGKLFSITSAVQSPANTSLNTLASYTLPGGTLQGGDVIRFTLGGVRGSHTRSTSIALTIGGETVADWSGMSTSTQTHWVIQATLTRRTASTMHGVAEIYWSTGGAAPTNWRKQTVSLTAQALNANTAIAFTVQMGGTPVLGDLTLSTMVVEKV